MSDVKMKLSDAEDVLIDNIDAGISTKIESSPGVGKSEMVERLCHKLSIRDGFEWGYAPTFLATQTPSDMIGFIFKGEKPWGPNGEMVAVTEPTMPTWMQTKDGRPLTAFKRGIVVIEEYGQGEGDVKRASAELFLNGRIGKWAVPNFGAGGWGVVALTNRMGVDRSGVTKDFDFVINRQQIIGLLPDPEGWERWAVEVERLDPFFVSFASQHSHLVFSETVPEVQGPWCTPRSLVKTAKFMVQRGRRMGIYKEPGDRLPDDPITMTAVAGMIGPGVTGHLFAYLKLLKDLPTFEAVVTNPTGTELPRSADLKMLVVYSFSYKVNVGNISAVLTYIDRLGKEFVMAFIRTACIRDYDLINSEPVSIWAKQNKQLMLQVTQSMRRT